MDISVNTAIKNMDKDWFSTNNDLSDLYFVLIGATSEMGPL